ncbi:hypothetical protein niasHS_008468 [Heterodera schachtii]|uniref:14-3-3 domain-containing protein n=1 Tax=Heterodera schachtii TaxID=97005 RepID=A0ABD2J6P2_HETSC
MERLAVRWSPHASAGLGHRCTSCSARHGESCFILSSWVCDMANSEILSLIRCDVLRVSVLQQQQLVSPLPILCQFPTMDKTKSYHFTVAQQIEAVFNFEQIVVAVQRMVQADAKLDKNERTFLARAYKKLIDVRRETWRFFCNIDENPQDADTDEQKQARTDLRLKTHEELRQLYREFLESLTKSSCQMPTTKRRMCSTTT